MAKVLVTESHLQDIADAIRAKNGSADTYTPGEMAAAIAAIQTGIEPKAVSFNQENEAVQTYLTNSESYPTAIASRDYSSTAAAALRAATAYRKDQPAGASVVLPGGTLFRGEYETNTVEGSNSLYNAVPGTHTPFAVVDSGVEAVGLISPSGQVRMIKTDSLYNVRDLGGWQGDGGKVKYGKLFRGCDVRLVNGEGYAISAADKKMFTKQLGIRAEVDFSADSFNESGIGPDVVYYPTAIGALYRQQLEIGSTGCTNTKAAIEAIFDCVRRGLPCYFHCTYGADRTGTVAFILLALLGVNLRDCDRDYELTSAWDATSTRIRTYSSYTDMVEYLISCGGSSLAQCAASWCSLAGISMTDVNAFRDAMIDGTPSTLTPDVDYSCKSITLSAVSGSIDKGAGASVTVTVTPTWTTDGITWSSSDSSVATVSGSGNTFTIHGVGEGTAVLTATCNGHTATYTATVVSHEEQPQYTGNILNTVGYTDGKRYNSSGNLVDKPAAYDTFASGYIDFALQNDGNFKLVLTGINNQVTVSSSYCTVCLYTYVSGAQTFRGSKPLTTDSTDAANGVTVTKIDGNKVELLFYAGSSRTINRIGISMRESGATASVVQEFPIVSGS